MNDSRLHLIPFSAFCSWAVTVVFRAEQTDVAAPIFHEQVLKTKNRSRQIDNIRRSATRQHVINDFAVVPLENIVGGRLNTTMHCGTDLLNIDPQNAIIFLYNTIVLADESEVFLLSMLSGRRLTTRNLDIERFHTLVKQWDPKVIVENLQMVECRGKGLEKQEFPHHNGIFNLSDFVLKVFN